VRPREASQLEEGPGGDPAAGPDGQSAEGPVDPLIGSTIAGKFQIEALLGAGAMGRVFRARQLTLDKPVAIKVLNASLAADPTFVARFAREARAAARLDHPNSIRVFDFGREPDGLFYIAMELVAGNDLATEMDERGPMPVDRIADILGQILAALSVAHEMGVLHRDLKPANVLILRRKDDEGRPIDVAKVCDFGIAKIVDSSSEAGAERAGTHPLTAGLVVGTPEYMAPEQARGAPVDARADLYAVGIMLYQMLTARVPFACDTPLGTVIKHVTERPARPSAIRPDVDPTLEAICLRALEKNPVDRFQTASEMRLALLEAARRPSAAGLPTADAAADTSPSPAVEPVAPVSIHELGAPKRDDSRHATLGGVTPGRALAARHSRWVVLAASAAALVAGVVVAARLRHDRTESRPPSPPPSADESATTVQPPPTIPAALATTATAAASPSAVEPVAVKAVSPPVQAVPSAKPTRTKSVPAAELSAKPPATAEPSVPSAPPEPPAAAVQTPVAVSAPPASNEPSPPVAIQPVVAPAPARPDVALARVFVEPAVRVSGATAGSVNRAVASAAVPLTACYRAVLPQLSGPFDGEATLHIETDGSGTITDARFAGPLGQSIQSCAASAVVGRRIANVDTGSASADIPLVFKPR
jgi:serine/threonine-protein kinase